MASIFKSLTPSATKRTRQTKLVLSYAPDWALTLVLAAAFKLLDRIDGYRREFSLDDSSLRHPFAEHVRVSSLSLYLISILVPFCVMATINLLTVKMWWDFHNSTLGLVLCQAITNSFTSVVKITVGRPRPDLLSRCKPPPGLTDPPFGLTSWTVCTETDSYIMKDGFRSFFSGHSSTSFAGLGFLSFYLAGKLHLFDSRGHTGKAWLSLSPLMGALLVAISRTMDYRHHWQDVTVGSLVGLAFAYFCYRLYFPALDSPTSHRPYSPRIKRDFDDATLPLTASHSQMPSQQSLPDEPQVIVNDLRQNHRTGLEPHSQPYADEPAAPPGTVPRQDPGFLADPWKEDDPFRGGLSNIAGPRTAPS